MSRSRPCFDRCFNVLMSLICLTPTENNKMYINMISFSSRAKKPNEIKPGTFSLLFAFTRDFLDYFPLILLFCLMMKGGFNCADIRCSFAALVDRRRTPQGQVWRLHKLRQQMSHLQAQRKLQQSAAGPVKLTFLRGSWESLCKGSLCIKILPSL